MLQNGKSPKDIVYDFVKNPILTSLFDVFSLLDIALTYYDLPIEVADKLTEFLEIEFFKEIKEQVFIKIDEEDL